MMFVASLLVASHVPTYNCQDACCHPPHVHTTSQVVYHKGDGGIEIHIEDDEKPFDTTKPELIDVDVVFKNEPDPDTYELFIGCGGCDEDDVPIEDSRVLVNSYETPTLEPFTQTTYRSIFPKDDRKFDTSSLTSALCPSKHFTIRILTNDTDIIWGAVVGLGERFTFTELLLFPVFILRNHGPVWNMMTWTIIVIALAAAPIVIFLAKMEIRRLGGTPLDIVTFRQKFAAREYFLELAVYGFVVAMLENFTHLIIAQAGIAIGSEFFVGLFAVSILPNALGIALALSCWFFWKNRKRYPRIADPRWAPLDMALAFGLLFFFGAGYYVGPFGLFVAASLKLYEAVQEYLEKRREKKNNETTPLKVGSYVVLPSIYI